MRWRWLALLSLVVVSAARAQDRGWLATVGQSDPHSVVSTDSGAKLLLGNTVVDLSRDSAVRAAFMWPIQMKAMTGVAGGLGFVALRTQDSAVPPVVDLVVKTDQRGAAEWARRVFALDQLVWIEAIAGGSDGSVTAAGTHGNAVVVVRLSTTGGLVWSRRLDHAATDRVANVVSLRDGGVLVVGAASHYATAVRLDRDGRLVWHRAFQRPDGGAGIYDAVEIANGDLIAVGRERVYATGDRDVVFMRLSKNGEIVWQKMVGGGGEDGAYAVAALGTSQFGSLALTDSFGDKKRDWLLIFDADGRLLRQSTIGDVPTAADSHTVIANAGGGGVWVAINRRIEPALVGVVTASTTCDVIAPTKAEARRGAWAIVEQPMDFGEDDQIKVESDSLGTIPIPVTAKPVCNQAASQAVASAAAKPAAKKAQPEETRFADSIAQRLVDRKFRELDATAAALREKKDVFDSGDWKLHWFYEGFDSARPALLAIGTDGAERLLKRWSATTGSATSRAALGRFYVAVAWQARGHGTYSTVVPAASDLYEKYIAQAIDMLQTLNAQGECDAECINQLIGAKNLGGWSAPLRKLLETEPGYWHAFESATYFLLPQWGGEPGAIGRFASEAADATRFVLGRGLYAKVRLVQPVEGEAGEPGNPPKRTYEWPVLRQALEDFQRRYPKSRANLNILASYAWLHRDRAAAAEAFANPLLVWEEQSPGWAERSEFERARTWALTPPATAAPITAAPVKPPFVNATTTPTAAAPAEPSAPHLVRLEMTVNGATERPLLFVIQRDGKLLSVTAIPNMNRYIQNGPPNSPPKAPSQVMMNATARIAGTAASLPDSITVTNDWREASNVATFDGGVPGLQPLVMGPNEMPRAGVTVIACRELQGRCSDRPFSAAWMGADSSLEGELRSFVVEATPAVEGLGQIIGAPVLDAGGEVIAVVSDVRQMGSRVQYTCSTLLHALRLPRAAVPISAR